jgi:ABC-type transport system substrate-binding protein
LFARVVRSNSAKMKSLLRVSILLGSLLGSAVVSAQAFTTSIGSPTSTSTAPAQTFTVTVGKVPASINPANAKHIADGSSGRS